MILPQILAIHRTDDSQVVLDLAVPAEHPAFAGHFPGNPILPGVVQLDWANRLGAEQFHLEPRPAIDFQVKYRKVIPPEAALSLTLRLTKGALQFEYRMGEDSASTGKIKVAAP